MNKNHHILLKEKNSKNRKIKEKVQFIEDSYFVPEMITGYGTQTLTFNMFYFFKKK